MQKDKEKTTKLGKIFQGLKVHGVSLPQLNRLLSLTRFWKPSFDVFKNLSVHDLFLLIIGLDQLNFS